MREPFKTREGVPLRRFMRLAPRRKIRAMGESFNDPKGVLGEAKRTYAMNGNTYLDNQILQTIEQISDPNKKLKALMAFEQVNLNSDKESDEDYEYYDEVDHENKDEEDEYTDDEYPCDDKYKEQHGCTNDNSDMKSKVYLANEKVKEADDASARLEETASIYKLNQQIQKMAHEIELLESMHKAEKQAKDQAEALVMEPNRRTGPRKGKASNGGKSRSISDVTSHEECATGEVLNNEPDGNIELLGRKYYGNKRLTPKRRQFLSSMLSYIESLRVNTDKQSVLGMADSMKSTCLDAGNSNNVPPKNETVTRSVRLSDEITDTIIDDKTTDVKSRKFDYEPKCQKCSQSNPVTSPTKIISADKSKLSQSSSATI